MSSETSNHPAFPEHFDLHASRVIDGVATSDDIAQIDRIATTNPAAWREVALLQHDARSLSAAVQPIVAAADRATLSNALANNSQDVFSTAHPGSTLRLRTARVLMWGGWAAAAAVAFAFVVQPRTPAIVGTAEPRSAGVASAAEALSEYFSHGRREGSVLGQLSEPVLVSSTPSADGKGYEVVFVRSIVERSRVDSLYRLAKDEAGNATPIRMSFPARTVDSANIAPDGTVLPTPNAPSAY